MYGDLDHGVAFPRDKQGVVQWTGKAARKLAMPFGTPGYHPAWYDTRILFALQANDGLEKRCRNAEHAAAYSRRLLDPIANASLDVYSLALIFLSFLFRLNISLPTAFWIAQQLHAAAAAFFASASESCPSSASSSSASFSSLPSRSYCGLSCTPAHVLLYHDVVEPCGEVVNSAGQKTSMRREYDFYYVTEERKKHRELLAKVKAGGVSMPLFQLIHDMLNRHAASRPTVAQVIQRLQQLINGT